MRLIDTSTLLLSEFFGDQIPKYAILSHTWENEEVSFQEWRKQRTSMRSKTGYAKIREACHVAEALGHRWLWADTVCIDKTSSADLSEAINSMCAWYSGSVECLVYLVDVTAESRKKNSKQSWVITNSRWFTRGWTLQELLAPPRVTFYDSKWKRLGTKKKYASDIELTTRIRAEDLLTPFQIHTCLRSVAQRMSWMAGRRTTRVEDMAYCMLGIFDINMPLLYGEGGKAFIRLQHEILRKDNDHTIFAWPSPSGATRSFLAPSPAAFAGMGNVVVKEYQKQVDGLYSLASGWTPRLGLTVPYSVTNLGLSIRLPLRRTATGFIAILNASEHLIPHDASLFHFGIVIQHTGRSGVLERTRVPGQRLRICERLPKPPLTDILLRIDHEYWITLGDVFFEQHYDVTCSNARGLFIMFDNRLNFTSPRLASHPKGCLDINTNILTFPSLESPDWMEMASAPATTLLLARSTATILCVSNNAQYYCGDEEPDLCILFTLSIVTEEVAGEVKTVAVFGHGILSPKSWDHSMLGSAGAYNNHWLHHDTGLKTLLGDELKRVFDKAAASENLEDLGREWPPLMCENDPVVQIGCCDAKYPGFKEVRMVCIRLEEDIVDHEETSSSQNSLRAMSFSSMHS